jgi:hypothetical protein
LVSLRNLKEKLLRRLLEVWAIENDNSIRARPGLNPCRTQPVLAYQ